MVGREVLLDVASPVHEPGGTVLEVSDLSVTDSRGVTAVSDVSFGVRQGEVFGIAGVDGNGQTELVEAITGMHHPTDGSVSFRGTDLTDRSRRDHIAAGMSYIPGDRQREGLVMDLDLTQNGLLGNQHSDEFTSAGTINWGGVEEHADGIVDQYDVRPAGTNAAARSLSGGNQQKFVVGREFERDPALLVAAQPTRGVDVGSIEFIHERLLALRAQDVGVLLVSSKLDEVQTLSDRLAVMYEGEFVRVVDPGEVTEEELGLLIAGEIPDRMADADEPAPEPVGGEVDRP